MVKFLLDLLYELGSQARLANSSDAEHRYQRAPICENPLFELSDFILPSVKLSRVGSLAPVYFGRCACNWAPVWGIRWLTCSARYEMKCLDSSTERMRSC